MSKEYHALDMANGKTYIGWMKFYDSNKKWVPEGVSLEDVLVTDTISAIDFDENHMQMVPKEHYIKVYREYAPILKENGAFLEIELYTPIEFPIVNLFKELLKCGIHFNTLILEDIKIKNPCIISDLDIGEDILSNK